MGIKQERLDLSKLRTLLITLNDNIGNSTTFLYPRSIENIEDHAEFVRYVPITDDLISISDGEEEHIFEIYNDLSRENLYYLIQRWPLEVNASSSIIFKKDVGTININMLIREKYWAILREIKSNVIGDFDVFVFARFRFTNTSMSVVNYAMSKDLKNKVPLLFPDVQPVPINSMMKLDKFISPTIGLYLMFPSKKVLYDFNISTIKISRIVGNNVTYIVNLADYLDNFFQMFLQTIYPNI